MSHTYLDRNRTVREIGFNSYEEYLASDLWASIRQKTFQVKGDDCYLCEGKANHVHHVGYGRAAMIGENLSPLIPLCKICHYKVEFDTKEGKRTVSLAQGAYIRLLKKRKRQLVQTSEGRQLLVNRYGVTTSRVNKMLRQSEKK